MTTAEYACVDCPSGVLSWDEARQHAHDNGHYVVKIEDDDDD